MNQNATIVYHPNNNNNADAFFVNNIDHSKLQKAFDEHDIYAIKCITIENDTAFSSDRNFKTIFTESDIQGFLKQWKINF